MPFVTIRTWPMKDEMKKKIIENVTKGIADTRIPAEHVFVVIEEIPKENWGSGGEQHSVKFKGMGED